ncbi:RFC checkpoint protein Rad17 [Candidozyma auris]
MPPRRNKKPLPKHEDESLSEEVDDDTEDTIIAKPSVKRSKPDLAVQWIDKYEPKRVEEVCINPKKLKEVGELIESMIFQRSDCRLLVLTGPAGCSKSTCVKLLAKKYLAEFHSSHITLSKSTDGNIVEYCDSNLEETHQKDHFRDFLDGCKFLVGGNLSLILIEDLPNVFHSDTLASFRIALRDWIFADKPLTLPPVVLCLSEVEMTQSLEPGRKAYYNIDNNLTVETLLGKDLLYSGSAQGLVRRIKFLPIAKTFMKKTLNRIVACEVRVFSKFNKGTLNGFINSMADSGDIRSSICNLQFWSLFPQMPLVQGDPQISLFHAVGKIVHSSSKYQDLDDDQSDALSIKTVADAYSNFSLLYLALLENYQIVNGGEFDIDIASCVVDALSINDTLNDIQESREESSRVQREVSDYVRYITRMQLSFRQANLVYGCLLPRIYNSFKYKLLNGRTRFSYNRLGGSFSPVIADDELPVMENEHEFDSREDDQFKADIQQAIMEDSAVQPDENQSDLSDAISESGVDTDEDLNDTLDEGLISSFKKPMLRGKVREAEDISDDPELDMLVSQGML